MPSQLRAAPRVVSLLGETSDGQLLFFRESDPAGDYQGTLEPKVASRLGLVSDADLSHQTVVVGNRLVRQPGTDQPDAVTSRLLGEDWASTAIPAGYRYLNFTRDGLLLAQGDQGEPQSLALVPWSGGPLTSLGAAPEGVAFWPQRVRDNDSSYALVNAISADPTAWGPFVVDTGSGVTWSMNRTLPPNCDALGGSWSIHDGVVAWFARNAVGICSAVVPSAAGEQMTVAFRPLSDAPAGATTSNPLSLLPVGDDVLVWRHQEDDTWGTGSDVPLLAVAQDGGSRVLAPSVASVVPSSSGHVVAVTGDTPGESSVRDYDVAIGSSTQFLGVEPIFAWSRGVAVDGDRVLSLDDSARQGALHQQRVDFDNASMGDASVLDTSVSVPVVAGSGATAWNKFGVLGGGHLDASGTRTAISAGNSMVGTDARWVAYAGGSLLDTTTGAVRPGAFRFPRPVFQDGVSYDAGSVVPGGRQDVVIATGSSARSASAVPVSGCPRVTSVQVAGSWMLVQCYQSADTGLVTTQLVDRTGTQPPQQITPPATLSLGNGFLVARTMAGVLTWRPAVGPPSTAWQPLGSALPKPGGGATDLAVAVSQGSVPTVAWTSGRTTYAARLPVASSPMPAHPTDVAPPTITDARAAGINQGVVVRWSAPDPAAHMTQYDVTAHSSAFGSRSDSRTYPGSQHDSAMALLTNGATYTVQVKAWNIAGSATTTLTATPRPPPPAPTNVQAHLDPITGRVDVTWDHADLPGTEPVSWFSVPSFGGPTNLPPTARSTSFVVPLGNSGPIEVIAHGLEQSQSASTPTKTFPGSDTTAPNATLGVLPGATLTGGTTLRLSATDDRALASRPIDVRWRYASAGRRLGSWAQPASWQRVPAGTLAVRLADGHTGCFSVRAHDLAGNHSAWSAPRCTSAALDDRRFSHSGPVRAVTSSSYFRSTALTTRRKNAAMRVATLNANTGWLVASTCSKCGQLRVLVAGRIAGTISLRSSTARNRALIRLPWTTPLTGRLEFRPVRNGQQVTVDGLVLQAR